MPKTPSQPYRKFYIERLYPLQDQFLSFLTRIREERFYLTGGTALSRFYYHHRFSEDLDFFSKEELPDFRGCVTEILNAAGKERFSCEAETASGHFLRCFIKENDLRLKIDFVNEAVYRWGNLKDAPEFSWIDNELNILANKLAALSRCEVKDIADIWVLAKHCSFSWREIFEIASKKSPVDPLEVSKIIQSVPEEELTRVQWAIDVSTAQIMTDLNTIAKDILVGNSNTLKIR